jgi:hypothetical protein
MNTIQSLVESANPWKSLQGDAAKLANKWAKTGLLEGLGEDVNKNNMALMLENQAKQLVVESNATNFGGNTFSGNGQGEQWAGIALPLVRKVFGQIAAKEFVSVQPMNLPSGLVFFLDFQYGNTKNPFQANNSLYGNSGSSTFPFSQNANNLNTFGNGGLFGAGRFTYSTNQFSASAAGTINTGSNYVSSSAVLANSYWAALGFNSDLSSSVVTGNIWKLTLSSLGAASASMDSDGFRGFTVSASGTTNITPANVLSAYTTFDGSTLTFYLTGSTTDIGGNYTNITVFYNKKTADNARGDFEDDMGATNTYSVPNAAGTSDITIPEININMQSQAITAKTKKLKAAWTPEFAQDLNAYQNLDAEAELTNIMSEYISLEIDLEILDMLISDVPSTNIEYWSAVNNTSYNGTTMAANITVNAGFFNTQGQWFQTLGTKLQKLSNKIHQLTLRGGANFMVVSPTIATVIESIPGFAANSNGDAADMEYAFGVQKAGQFNSRYTVYKNPYMTENTILVGFRGKQFLEAGAVFAPYVPLIMTPLIYDPETFTPRKGLLTRFAKKMLRPEFYGKIYVHGLNTL